MTERLPSKENDSLDALIKRYDQISEEWRQALREVKKQPTPPSSVADLVANDRLAELYTSLRQTQEEMIRAAGRE
jgi:hypothetical protein